MKRAKAIMVQGTMSNVGKSIIAAALCRIFKQDGYSAAPFKSQNMALNSFITDEGLEIGRAQAVQAEAAEIEPSVLMNPILLKPTCDMGSQVILNGEVVGNMSAAEYYKNKHKFIPSIINSYSLLSEKYDIIVLEGAGSPAEINLKKDDIVNMKMAKIAKAPVLLVGDIDRGGVFAQLLGTIDLLDEDEKSYIKGMIINKFRGDKLLLKSGTDMLENRAKKPVIGVVPYAHFDIDDEDSLTERFNKKNNSGFLLDIAVIKLPRISNFTDFAAFECAEGVNVRYVESADDFKDPDLIIIPGTKSTIDDLLFIRANGIEAKIKQSAAKGKAVFGICGGFQMLGKVISDEGAEHKGEIKGMELLNIKTYFKQNKTRTRVKGRFENIGGIFKNLKGISFEGYEIHMGVSYPSEGGINMNVIYNAAEEEIKKDGACSNNIYGSYVHGIFDRREVADKIISALAEEKGISSENIKAFNMAEYKKGQYDLLAQTVRENIDMKKIYEILEKGI